MYDINDDDGRYVCITHQTFTPCDEGDFHLISNWVADVKRIEKVINKRNV